MNGLTRQNIAGLMKVGLLMLVAACANDPPPVQPMGQPPDWLSRVPISQGELCAIGVSGPTYYPEDAVINSKAQAFAELSRSIESKVIADLNVNTSGSGSGSSQKITDSVQLKSEELIRLAQVRAQWVNPGGQSTRGERGTVYTMVCMPMAEVQQKK